MQADVPRLPAGEERGSEGWCSEGPSSRAGLHARVADRGRYRVSVGRFDRIRSIFDKIFGCDNDKNLFARKLLASALLKGGHAAKAVEALDPALKDYPQDVAVLTLAGEANMQAKAFSKATEYFEKASALDPKAAALHTELGLSKLGLGKSADAISELETAVDDG